MKIVLQRVKTASVEIAGRTVGRIGRGVCLLVGIEKGDNQEIVRYLAQKTAELRIFPDRDGKMNLSLIDTGGAVLAVSQFTLAASIRKGRRPSFDRAELPEKAAALLDDFVRCLKDVHRLEVETGVFGAMMDVHLVNDGPVTFILSKCV
jgi:D-tyrosyl-tRNA(Tyr) deacylase